MVMNVYSWFNEWMHGQRRKTNVVDGDQTEGSDRWWWAAAKPRVGAGRLNGDQHTFDGSILSFGFNLDSGLVWSWVAKSQELFCRVCLAGDVVIGHWHQTILDGGWDDGDMSGLKSGALKLLVRWMSALMQCRIDEYGYGDDVPAMK
jgi:hypothetical protein